MPIAIGCTFRGAGQRLRHLAHMALLSAPALLLAPTAATAGVTVFESAGSTPAAITPTRDAFRLAIGDARREINWDGVPDASSDPNAFAGDFFNARGALFSTPDGTGLLVSANAGQSAAPLFGFPGDLQSFSAQKLFAVVGGRTLDIRFTVPGTSQAATVSAFGAVFVDLEDSNTTDFTQMQFFDANDVLLFSRNGLTAGNQGLSFLGGMANAGERIARVSITMPNNFLLANGSRANEITDFVVMDDFIYAAPAAVPEPQAWAMLAAGLACLGWRGRRRS
jgi:hypothetical protein